ncbi:MAG TPA: RcnB family protein [Enterobacteriaceae bacterium]|nr:RcnB family protein [Enterobacteriaceae bacterium]
MSKAKVMLAAALLACAGSAFAAPVQAPAPEATAKTGIQEYEIQEFIADFTRFRIGDTAPALYLTDEYNIKQWKLRNLPAPDAGSHWTYMGENYVLIGDVDGKIIKAYDGEIFYHH